MNPIDRLTDSEIQRVNSAHNWRTYTVDQRQRRVGNPHGRLHKVPSDHAERCDRELGVKGKSVVEFGCNEGTDTASLCARAFSVIALDGRSENVEKTRVRCGLFGARPDVRVLDVDRQDPPAADLFFHVGVLYHLTDPVRHLRAIAKLCRSLYLDTHYAEGTDRSYRSADGRVYRCLYYPEAPTASQAGLSPYARWLEKDLIEGILRESRLSVKVVEVRSERNGPRMTIAARKD